MSSINWTGNKVLDSGTARKQVRNPSQAVQSSQTAPASPSAFQPDQTPQTTQTSPSSYLPPVGQPSPSVAQIQTLDEPTGSVQGPPPSTEPGFIPYYLASNIGRNVRAEFVIGTNQYIDKAGMLSEVGINYFVLRDINSRTDIMCDLYSVKFVTILRP